MSRVDKLKSFIGSINIAKDLSEEKLLEIGNEAVDGYLADLRSRADWEEDLNRWTELAIQIVKQKTYPWRNASNVKFPLLSTASMQFNARAYPTLIPPDGKIVKCKKTGADQDGQKQARADRISAHMSYQILEEMEDWEEDMDKLLLILPITGTAFKKTYFDPTKQKNVSKLIYPTDLVVNHWAQNMVDTERKTEVMYLSQRKIKERQLMGFYLDIDLGEPISEPKPNQGSMDVDKTTPYTILEQHTFLDLDDDGYSEPYIVLVEEKTRKVLRITARYTEEDVYLDEKQKVIQITPIEYYTKYSFVPNPDGGFYDIGFGRLLGSINASADTLINQLIDSGTLNNLQAGFIGKGLRLRMGESQFQPGEWKAVNATGDDIKKQIFPLPTKEPSGVLMDLLQFLIQSGKELASVAEIFVGKMPGQNTPATTTMASIEQGMKVFTAVYKRIYRSLTEEFRKLYKLNYRYLDPQQYIDIIDEQVQQSDYAGSENDIVPAADPQATVAQEKAQKGQYLLQLLSLGTLNPIQVTSYLLDAYEIPNKDQFMIQQPPPDPAAQQMQQEMEMKQKEAEMKMLIAQTQAQHKIQVEELKAKISLAEAEQKNQLEMQKAQIDMKWKQLEAVLKAQEAQATHAMSMQQQSDQHQMNMVTGAESHAQAMRQNEEKMKQQPQKGKDSGK